MTGVPMDSMIISAFASSSRSGRHGKRTARHLPRRIRAYSLSLAHFPCPGEPCQLVIGAGLIPKRAHSQRWTPSLSAGGSLKKSSSSSRHSSRCSWVALPNHIGCHQPVTTAWHKSQRVIRFLRISGPPWARGVMWWACNWQCGSPFRSPQIWHWKRSRVLTDVASRRHSVA